MSITYSKFTDFSDIKNILLIDNNVNDYSVIFDSVNTFTLPIVYSNHSSTIELHDFLLQNFTTIHRIGIVFASSNNSPKMFFDNKYLCSDENTEFIINLIKEFNVINIDFLACDTLLYSIYVDYYQLLTTNTNVIVGASDNKVGNPKSGGDWIMESTNEDIKEIYFSDKIEDYKYLLDGVATHTIVLLNDGTIYGCGSNSYGQLGLGNDTNYYEYFTKMVMTSIPVDVTPKFIACGRNHTIVLMTDGTIYGCGDNIYGQLGIGSDIPKYTSLTKMTTIPNYLTPKYIACGNDFTIVLMTNGTIYGCGDNTHGQLGNKTNSNIYNYLTEMTTIPVNKTPKIIACDYSSIIVLMTDGTIYGCGKNEYGQLGNGTNSNIYNYLTEMTTIPTYVTPKFIACGGNNGSTLVLMTDGTIYGCGNNEYGQLGNKTNSNNYNYLTKMTTIPNGVTPKSISCNYGSTLVLMTDGTIYGCGYNSVGQLGIGKNKNEKTIYNELIQMTNIPDSVTPKSISSSAKSSTIILMTDGTIYACGISSTGQLGIGKNNIYQSSVIVIVNNIYSTNPVNVNYIDAPVPSLISSGIPITNIKSLTNNFIVTFVYTASELKVAGYSISELKDAGYSISELKVAGYSIRELKVAGYSISELKDVGYTDSEILAAGYTDSELLDAGYTDIYFQKVCKTCTDNSTTDHIVEYKPLKTMRHTDNISQKMKQAAFIRRTQNTSITQTDAINFRFKNL